MRSSPKIFGTRGWHSDVQTSHYHASSTSITELPASKLNGGYILMPHFSLVFTY